MSHDTREKLVRMANQIGTFFNSKPHEEGVAGVAEHINKFWEPRMRRQFFEVVDAGGGGLLPIVLEAAANRASARASRPMQDRPTAREWRQENRSARSPPRRADATQAAVRSSAAGAR
jgi:formate dehydrogenase subunit delta